MTTLASIQEFLGRKRLAVIGVSHNPRDFTRGLFRELRTRGYDAIPVHPGLSAIDGITCFSSVRDISPPVDAALLLTNSSTTGQVVKECAEAGVHQVWMYRAGGAGAVNAEAVHFCESKGIGVVEGECPYMFLPHAGFIHNAHGFCRRLFGGYPK